MIHKWHLRSLVSTLVQRIFLAPPFLLYCEWHESEWIVTVIGIVVDYEKGNTDTHWDINKWIPLHTGA